MAGVHIRGSVRYLPGPWGAARAAGRVDVKVIDVDLGNANDTIWSGMTDADGAFSGTTADWRDTRTVTTGRGPASVTTQVADPTDVMVLRVRISERIGNRLFQVELPFVPVPAGTSTPLLVVPWGPAGHGRLVVNGASVPGLQAFSTVLGEMFGIGVAVARHQVRHEVAVFGEGMATLRAEVERLGISLRDLESAFLALAPRAGGEVRTAANRVQVQAAPITRNTTRAGEALFEAGIGAAGRRSDPNAAQRELNLARQKQEEVRQRILAFLAGLEPIFVRATAATDAAAQSLVPLAFQVVRIIVAVVVSAVQTVSLGAASALAALAIAVIAGVVSAVAAVVQSIPSLMRLAGLESVASDAQALLGQIGLSTWLGSFVMVIVVVCALIIAMAAAPGDAWAWAIERVSDAEGAQGLRFVFSR